MDLAPACCALLTAAGDLVVDDNWRARFPVWPAEVPAAAHAATGSWRLIRDRQAWTVLATRLEHHLLFVAQPVTDPAQAELGQILRTLAHDCNNQLHVIGSVVETLQAELSWEPADALLLQDLAEAAAVAVGKTADLGLLGRALSWPLEPVELLETVANVQDQIALRVDPPDSSTPRLVACPTASVTVLGHPALLENALRKLLDHLLGTPESGPIELAVRGVEDGGPELLLRLDAGDLRAAVAPELLGPGGGEEAPFRRRVRLDILRRAMQALQIEVHLSDEPRPALRLRFRPAP